MSETTQERRIRRLARRLGLRAYKDACIINVWNVASPDSNVQLASALSADNVLAWLLWWERSREVCAREAEAALSRLKEELLLLTKGDHERPIDVMLIQIVREHKIKVSRFAAGEPVARG